MYKLYIYSKQKMLFEVWEMVLSILQHSCCIWSAFVAVDISCLTLWFGLFFLWAILSANPSMDHFQYYARVCTWGLTTWQWLEGTKDPTWQASWLIHVCTALLQGLQEQTVGDIPDHSCCEKAHRFPLQCWMLMFKLFTLCWWPVGDLLGLLVVLWHMFLPRFLVVGI